MATFIFNPPNPGNLNGQTLGAVPGDILCFTSGTYTNLIGLRNFSGTASAPIYIMSQGGQAVFDHNGGDGFAFWLDSDNGRSYGLEFNGVTGTSGQYNLRFNNRLFLRYGSGCTVRGCYFDGSTSEQTIGLHFKQPDSGDGALVQDFLVEDCLFENWDGEGIYGGRTGAGIPTDEWLMDNVTIQYCTFRDCTEGIQLNRVRQNGVIRYNAVYDSTPENAASSAYNTALNVGRSDDMKIYGNIIDGCDGNGISYNGDINPPGLATGSSIVIRSNLVINVATGTVVGMDRGIVVFSNTNTSPVFIQHNTVFNVGDGTEGDGIQTSNSNGVVENNIILNCDNQAINNAGGSTYSDNYNQDDGDTVLGAGFVDAANFDFRLEQDSGLVTGTATLLDGFPLLNFYGSEGVASDLRLTNDCGNTGTLDNIITLSDWVTRGSRI